ncbi:MAG: alpha/beta fold hydrolase [Deltaproteobacteria bacterium]|nr:alpha/beta fold hydrolase [bacterium]MCB9475270.1 alpha/beta fold hydrolase [Deltaproteobacteria bacterium]MCB9479504.1 alpha/beta fold hydrolase [Deltaproteobacteria bacterium]MCB9489612.1 alpha/beta fold hydrolase [Deltaproteobacteria bacterium]
MDMVGTGRVTEVSGTTITWGELGVGPPLVLVHGIQDCHRTWRRTAPFLARHFRVLMVDLPGHGYSGRPDAPYTLAWHAKMLAEWMEAIHVPSAHFCGHSYGGGVAQWMVLEQRERIERLALVSSGGLGRDVAIGMRLAAFPYFGHRIAPTALKHALPYALKYASATFGHMEPEEIERAVRINDIPGTGMAFQRTLEGVINVFGQHTQMAHRVDEVEDMPPVALFWGAKDPIIPVKHGRRTVKMAEGVTLTEYKGIGHYPHLDLPERFAEDLHAFLSDPHRPKARFTGA